MRASLIILCVTILMSDLSAQSHEVMGEVVFATFSMKTMKKMQQPQPNQVIPYKAVTKFPPYFGYNLSMSFSVGDRWTLGPRFQYISSGGRLFYSDYSGYALQDQLLVGYGVAVQGRYLLTQPGKLPAWFTIAGGALFSKATFVSEGAFTGGQPSRDQFEVSSVNYVIAPGLQVKKNVFGERLSVALSAGYEYQIHGKLKSGSGVLTDSQGGNVYAEWDGIRIGLGLAWVIQTNNDDED